MGLIGGCTNRCWRSVVGTILALTLWSATSIGAAQALNRQVDFNIPAQPLASAVIEFSKQANLQVLASSEKLNGVKTAGVKGRLSIEQGLRALLAGTGFSFRVAGEGTVTLIPGEISAVSPGQPAQGSSSGSNATSTKEVGQEPERSRSQEQEPASAPSALGRRSSEKLESLEVTGTRIPRIVAEGPQEVKVYTREQIDRSGQTSVADFLNTLPEVSISIGEDNYLAIAGQGHATTVQLRGLPIGTTLVLLNGRRLETAGSQQGKFFDLNNLPLSAVDRIEVLAEGSSAIYGSDAIAGVVNIILKRDLDSFEGSVKYGHASGFDDTVASLAWGKQWANGNFSIIGSYQTHSELQGFERRLTATDDRTAFGGADHRLNICNPGTVFTTDGSPLPGGPPGSTASFAAVSPTAMGNPRVTGFQGTYGAMNLCNIGGYVAIIPSTRRAAVVLSGDYDLTPSVQFFAEFVASRIEQLDFGDPPFTFAVPGFIQHTIPASNPYNPFGIPVGVSYLFTDVGRQGLPLDTTFLRPLIGVRGDLPEGWRWEVAGWDSQDRSTFTQQHSLNDAALQAVLDSSDPATTLNLFTAGPPGSPQLLQSIIYDQVTRFSSRTQAINGFARGPLIQLPSGPLNIVLGAEYGRDKLYSDQVNVAGVAPDTQATNYRNRYALFLEAHAPILPNHSDPPAGDTLAVTVAARYDHYSDFGSTTNPQVGVEWRPLDTLLVRGAYATAFKAPDLYQLYQPIQAFQSFVTDPRDGNLYPVTLTVGGNPHLTAQTGQSHSVGFVYSSKEIRDLQLSITQWGIEEDKNIQALSSDVIVANENLFPGRVTRNAAGIITQVDGTLSNFGEIRVAGIDYRLNYALETELGRFFPSLIASQTYRYTAALLPNAPATVRVSQANDDGNWAPRWKGTVALGWKLGPYSASIDSRYVGSYQDYDSTRKIGNFWLADANFQYAIGKALLSVNPSLGGAYLEFGGVNIFDRQPQFSNFNFGTVGYDPAQGDIRGRFLYARLGFKL